MVKDVLNEIKLEYTNILGDNLVGIYIHGSIAFQCFNYEKSDIDFIVVVEDEISLMVKKKLIEVLLKLNPLAPKKGFEMSVVLKKYCQHFIYPSPYELHYSISHLSKIKDNIESYCNTSNGLDYDLASHFMVIHTVGITLCGLDKDNVFSVVPKQYYLDSIIRDILDANIYLIDNPVYYILNLCRVYAYKKEQCVLSKKDAAVWALKNCSEEYFDIIENALNYYLKNIDFVFNDIVIKFKDYIFNQLDLRTYENKFKHC